jgi:hypothetical protein
MGTREYCNETASRFGDRLFGQSQGVEIVIEPFVLHQGGMVALLDDAASIEHENPVGSLNCAQPMRDYKCRLTRGTRKGDRLLFYGFIDISIAGSGRKVACPLFVTSGVLGRDIQLCGELWIAGRRAL